MTEPGSVQCRPPASPPFRCGSFSATALASRAAKLTPNSRFSASASCDCDAHRLRAAEQLDPAAPPDEIEGAGFLGEGEMLRHGALDERRIAAGDGGMAGRSRRPPVARQERRQLRQRRQVIMRVRGVVHGVAQERAEIVREPVREDALALDEPGIAEGGLLPGPAPVDERHGPAALLQVQGHRYADDPGAQNHHVRPHRSSPTPLPERR